MNFVNNKHKCRKLRQQTIDVTITVQNISKSRVFITI